MVQVRIQSSPIEHKEDREREKIGRDVVGTFVQVRSNDLLLSGIPRLDSGICTLVQIDSIRLGPGLVVLSTNDWVRYSLLFTNGKVRRFFR